MMRSRLLSLALIGAGLGLAPTVTYLAVAPAYAAGNQVRADVGKPLKEAQEAIQAGRYAAASAALRHAEAVPGTTPYEAFLIAYFHGQIAQATRDYATAAKSFETIYNSSFATEAQKADLPLAIGQFAYASQDYSKAITWFNRYIRSGGADPKARELLAQAYYATNDYANAERYLKPQLEAAERAGQAPPENELLILLQSQDKLNEPDTATLTQLINYYPKPEYWGVAIQHVEASPGFADRLALDIDRLELQLGLLTTSDQYMEMAQAALGENLPAEAQAVMASGYAKGILGTGADAGRQKRLQAQIDAKVAEERRSIDAGAAAAGKQATGLGSVNIGFEYVMYGQFDQGLPLMESGIEKDSLKHPDDAQLHLGIGYIKAGQKDKAIEALKQVQGTDGSGDIARLWIVVAKKPS
jgi:tetratricopeptide (TPR) repeat protein